MESLEPLRLLATVIWQNDVSGNWEDASNWSTGSLPGPADDVVIPFSDITVTHSRDTSAIHSLDDQARIDFTGGFLTLNTALITSTIDNTLNFSVGTIGGPGDLAVAGPLNWSGGTLSGTGATNANGGLNLSGALANKFLDSRTLNSGNGTWTGTGPVLASNGATFNNNGTFDVQSNVNFFAVGGATPTFNNSGTFRKSAGTGTTSIGAVFNDTGTVDVLAGTLALTNGGADSGAFTVAAGATLNFAGGVHDLDAASSIIGDGTVGFSSDTRVNIAGTYNVGSTNINGVNYNPFQGLGTTANFLSDASTGSLNLSGGALVGPGTVHVTGLLTWTGGFMVGPGVTNADGGMSISGNVSVFGSAKSLDNRTLNNNGIATWTGTGPIITIRGSTFNNNNTLDLQSNASFNWAGFSGGLATFNNAGTLRKSGGTGASTVQAVFNNPSTVDVLTGTLALDGGGTDSGAFTVAAGATLGFGNPNSSFGGTHDLDASSSVTGPGTVTFDNNTQIAGTYDVGNTRIAPNILFTIVDFISNARTGTLNLGIGGFLEGPGTVDVNGLLTWTGGTMRGPGTTNANGGMNINGGSFLSPTLDNRTLNNFGPATDTGFVQFSNGAILNNLDGAVFNLQGLPVFFTSGATSTFNNAGTLRKSASTGFTDMPLVFNNTGTVDVMTGTLQLSRGGTSTGTFTVAAGATLGLGGAHRLVVGSSVTGGGNVSISGSGTTIDIYGIYTIDGATTVSSGATGDFLNDASTGSLANNGGTVRIGAGTTLAATGSYTQGSGTTNLGGGTLTAGTGVNIQGGNFFGPGTINGDVTNAAQLSPGTPTSPGILTINGSYTQTSTGVLNIKVGGLTPGTQYDQLNVSGLATLAGTLNIILINMFSPNIGDTFVILTYGSRFGAFSTVTGVSLIGERLDLSYLANELDLVTVPSP
jgi:hypothetical protein